MKDFRLMGPYMIKIQYESRKGQITSYIPITLAKKIKSHLDIGKYNNVGFISVLFFRQRGREEGPTN